MTFRSTDPMGGAASVASPQLRLFSDREVQLACGECGTLFTADTGYETVCPKCLEDIRAARWPSRDRISQGERWRRRRSR